MKPIKIVAKAIIFNKQDKVLVLRKSEAERNVKNSHGWDFPGGGIEAEEPLTEALFREIREETGLKVKLVAPAYIYDEVQEEKHLIICKFTCDQPVGELSLSDEHDDAIWVHVDNLHEEDFPEWMKDEIKRAFRVYREFRG